MASFSQGGGGVLAHAAQMPELIKAAVLYYPATSWARNLAAVTRRIRIPILVLAAERDRSNNCCLIEHLREMESVARANRIPLELVVYPDAQHGSTWPGSPTAPRMPPTLGAARPPLSPFITP